MKKSTLVFGLSLIILASCGKKSTKKEEGDHAQTEQTSTPSENPISVMQTDTSALTGLKNTYHSDKIGWTIKIPKGWKLLETKQLEAYDQQADALLAPSDNPAQPKMEYLVAFQKDEYNMFSSMIEPFYEKYPGEYEETFKDIKENLHTAFTVQKVNVDTSSGEMMLAGKKFLYYNTGIYDKNFMYIMNQIMFSTLYKGYDFSINITYKGDENLDSMVALLNSSVFE